MGLESLALPRMVVPRPSVARNPVKLEFPPGKTVRLVVEHPLALGVERDVVVPAAGQTSDVHVGMQMLHRPRLYVTVEGGEDAMLPSISLRFSRLSGQGGATLIAKRGDGPQAFVVDEVALAPASYFVSPEPGCLGSRQSYLLPAVQQIEVPAAGDMHLRLPLAIGGRFETRLLSPAEKPWSGSLRLVDAAGRTCMERSIYHLPNGQRYDFDLDLALDADLIPEEEEFAIDSGITAPRSFDTSDAVGDIAAEALEARRLSHQQRQEDDHGVFPAGVYTLMITSDGHADWSQTIELSAGETTAVHASLGR